MQRIRTRKNEDGTFTVSVVALVQRRRVRRIGVAKDIGEAKALQEKYIAELDTLAKQSTLT